MISWSARNRDSSVVAAQQMELALEALLGQGARNCGTLHLSLVVYNHSCIVLKVDELSILSSECLPLSDDYSRHHLLPQFWLSLLDRGQNHISTASRRQSVQTSTDSVNCNHIQV